MRTQSWMLVVGFLVLLGCSKPNPVPSEPLATLANTYWKLTELDGMPVVMEPGQEREPFFQVQEGPAWVRGFSGCNRFSGAYRLDGRSLSLGPLAFTRRACIVAMELERKFLEVLEETATFAIAGENLTLFDAQSRPTGRFVAVYFD